tara:strand:+ start:669 stop:995 length:327 start_codon:yes stop_codon:yes gene_type:complete
MNEIYQKFKNYETIQVPIRGKTYTLWIADDDRKRGVGLSGISRKPDNYGMLFIYDNDTDIAFTMRKTHIPLEILFLDKNLKLVEKFRCKPFQYELIKPAQKFRYVIEI